MKDHLPECFSNKLSGDSRHCICIELRSCKERVLNSARDAVKKLHGSDMGVWDTTAWIMKSSAIAAIEALKEKT